VMITEFPMVRRPVGQFRQRKRFDLSGALDNSLLLS
jgi:hypothetical protein